MINVYIETMGCPKNQEDSERVAGLLSYKGNNIVDDPEDANVLIVNTCGFIEDAKRESIDAILSLVQEKGNDKKLIVTGCLAQKYGNELYDEFKEVDAFLGVNDYTDLPEIINDLTNIDNNEKILRIEGKPDFLKSERQLFDSKHTAYLKVAEGCSNNCSYCVIPEIRGPYRSVPQEDIVKEAEILVENGAKELVLIAQDVSSYGIDLYQEYALPELLKKLCDIENLKWIRLLYCYEERITDELINVMAEEQKICNYIDIPLQHISDDILKSMNRKTSSAHVKATVGKLRRNVPDIAIRTTFITGFPGEMEEDFYQLKDFIEETQFDRMGVFSYSREEGTPAAQMKEQIPSEVADNRRDELMRTQMDISFKKNEAMVGNTYHVLIDEIEDGICYGRTEYDAPEIDNAVIIYDAVDVNVGDFLKVKIVDAYDYDLIGEIEYEPS